MNDFLQTLKNLGPARLGIMGGVVLMLIVFFIFISFRVASPEMKMLYSDLPSQDSSNVAAALEEAQINYRITNNGSRVLVPESEVGRARMLLAEEGLPNGGSMGYEVFDKQSGFGTTNFVQNINQVRALEGELAETIRSLDTIRSARVHLVLPQRELFSRESRAASASVYLGLDPGADMGQGQVGAIQSLVASGVPELKPDKVSVVDGSGKLLARGGGDSESMMQARNQERQRNYEARLTRKIEELVGRTVGFENVRANVTAKLNFNKVTTKSENYDPAEQVARSTKTVEETTFEQEPASKDVTVKNNLPGVNNKTGDGGPVSKSSSTQEVTNYEISKTVRNMVKEVGEVDQLSVGVLVDGQYVTGDNGKENYEPRNQEQLQQIESLVKSAIGFNAKRGDSLEVVNMQFAQTDTGATDTETNTIFGFERSDLIDAAEVITVAIMVILVVLLVIQPMVGRLLAAEGSDIDAETERDLLTGGEENPALEGPQEGAPQQQEEGEDDSMIDMQKVEGQVKASSIRKVEDIVESYPSETVSVLRSWMSQESS